MNRKRWLLIGLGVIILIFGAVFSGWRELEGNALQETIDQTMGDDLTIREGSGDKKIVVIPIHGTITSESSGSLLSDNTTYDQQRLLDGIEALKADSSVAGIILEVDSGGGEVYASEEMYNAIKQLKAEKHIPVYVNMKSVDASGAYMISMAGDKLYAHPETLTGSIGVILTQPNYSELADKVGLSQNIYKSGKVKDAGNAFREPTEEEKQIFQGIIDESYENFVKIVANGRKMNEDNVRKLADGRVYTAKQAKANGLVDEIGDQNAVIDQMIKDLKLDHPSVSYMPMSTGQWERFASVLGYVVERIESHWSSDTQSGSPASLEKLMHQTHSPVVWAIYGGITE